MKYSMENLTSTNHFMAFQSLKWDSFPVSGAPLIRLGFYPQRLEFQWCELDHKNYSGSCEINPNKKTVESNVLPNDDFNIVQPQTHLGVCKILFMYMYCICISKHIVCMDASSIPTSMRCRVSTYQHSRSTKWVPQPQLNLIWCYMFYICFV